MATIRWEPAAETNQPRSFNAIVNVWDISEPSGLSLMQEVSANETRGIGSSSSDECHDKGSKGAHAVICMINPWSDASLDFARLCIVLYLPQLALF